MLFSPLLTRLIYAYFFMKEADMEVEADQVMSGSHQPIEIFCSYAHADEHWRQQLDIHLSLMQRQGLVSIWHDRRIIPSQDWAQAIDSHLTSAWVILLLISPDFLASDYCYGIEMQRALERHQAGQARVIPILLRPVDWKGAPFARLQALPTNAKAITSWSNQDEAFADVAAGIRRAIEDPARLTARSSHATFPPVWNVPYAHNPFFTGREELLSRLEKQLQTGQPSTLSQPQAISGLGGIGKTQIAVEYAYRHRQDYQAVLWARAENREMLTSSLVEMATLLNLPQKDAQDQSLTIQAVKSWLQTHGEWLLILDNADEPAFLGEFLPWAPAGHILLTTRTQALGELARRIEVGTFTPEQGTLFLLRRASLLAADAPLEQATAGDRQVARQISQELGWLPLALDQAGAYVEETGCRLQDYQRIYQQHRRELLKQRGGLVRSHPEPVATTWSLSFVRVQQKMPAAAELLRLCAFLAPEDIAEEMITQGAPHLGPLLEPIARDAYEFNQAIEVLRAYSLVQRDPSTGALSIHRLVQAVLRDALPAEEAQLWAERTVCVVNAAFPKVEFVQWPLCERYLPHALVCAEEVERCNMTLLDAASLLDRVGWYLDDRARYREAEPLYQRALAIREQQLGPEHPDTATSLNNLALLYRAQGKYEQAEPLYQRALEIDEEAFGPEHPELATDLNNLALLYDNQGKYEQAEPLYQRALAIREQQLGPEHPDTASSLNNLAVLYRAQGKYEQAEPLYQRALAILEQQLGPEHPSTATSLNNLALLYQDQGKYEQAEPLYQRALAIYEQQLGLEHPNTVIVRKNYISLLRAMGRQDEAGQMEGGNTL